MSKDVRTRMKPAAYETGFSLDHGIFARLRVEDYRATTHLLKSMEI